MSDVSSTPQEDVKPSRYGLERVCRSCFWWDHDRGDAPARSTVGAPRVEAHRAPCRLTPAAHVKQGEEWCREWLGADSDWQGAGRL